FILLHDGGGDRSQTLMALPRIIHYLKQQGYSFSTVAGMIGKTRDDVMPPLKDPHDRFLSHVNWIIALGLFLSGRLVFSLFIIAIVLSMGRTALIAFLAWRQKKISARRTLNGLNPAPLVSIIVPAYNEEITAPRTIANLLDATYEPLEIIFVDDGSSDKTFAVVSQRFGKDPRVRVFTKANGGKASALNFGIARAGGAFLVCIDADTQLKPDAVGNLMRMFSDPATGAVAGNVKVGNARKILTKWQSIEYITSQNFDRRAFDLLNCILVVPGAIGAFRREAVVQAGGFTSDTLAEDCDLTIRLLSAGWRIRTCPGAIAFTEAPETVRMFIKQRFRWSFGILQSIWKNRSAMANPSHKTLGMVGLPNALLFSYMLPLFAPLTDLMMLFSIFFGNWRQIIIYYCAFTLVDTLAAFIAFSFEHERYGLLIYLVPQRIVYRALMYWVLIKSLFAALKGQLVGWGFLKRTGTVSVFKIDLPTPMK
ncbi:MAG: glycosyltransferase, partial [Chitinivibrionales bacterium]|nr:glycosyltransferase [Chitinivibrionales bacterium]